jgi:hypothetical protein
MTPKQSDGADTESQPTESQPQDGAPNMETAEQHSGSDHVSYGANSNLSPAATQSPEDEQAAREIEQQHQHKDS